MVADVVAGFAEGNSSYGVAVPATCAGLAVDPKVALTCDVTSHVLAVLPEIVKEKACGWIKDALSQFSSSWVATYLSGQCSILMASFGRHDDQYFVEHGGVSGTCALGPLSPLLEVVA